MRRWTAGTDQERLQKWSSAYRRWGLGRRATGGRHSVLQRQREGEITVLKGRGKDGPVIKRETAAVWAKVLAVWRDWKTISPMYTKKYQVWSSTQTSYTARVATLV